MSILKLFIAIGTLEVNAVEAKAMNYDFMSSKNFLTPLSQLDAFGL